MAQDIVVTLVARAFRGRPVAAALVALVATALVATACSGATAGVDLHEGPGLVPGAAAGDPPGSQEATVATRREGHLVAAAHGGFAPQRVGGKTAAPAGPVAPGLPPAPGIDGAPPSELQWFAIGYGWGPGLVAAPVQPTFWPTWTFVATLAFTGGGTQAFAVPLGATPTTHILIEAEATCAPPLTGASAWVNGSFTPLTMYLAGQRLVGGLEQALLRVGGGGVVLLSEVDLAFHTPTALACPIAVYVVRT